MAWPLHVALAYHRAEEPTRQRLLEIAKRSNWGSPTETVAPPKPNKLLRSLPLAKQCKYLGERLTAEEVKEKQLAGCRSCNNEVPAFHCKLPGAKKFNDGPYTRLGDCCGCGDWAKPDLEMSATESSRWPIRFDQHNLAPEVPGLRFNTSLIEHGDGYALAFRNGWKGSNIYIQRLDTTFNPKGEAVKLELRHRDASFGREDARLFYHKNALHISFIGVMGRQRYTHTNQLFARLGDDFEVQDIFHPVIAKRQKFEKNHQYFDYQNQLYAVYTIAPHVVLKIDSNTATRAYETPCKIPWSGGHLRGGASPVLIGDEYWCFFHGKHQHPLTYNIGVYCFSAKPPFQITRMTPDPILEADPATNPGNYCPVVFPCGAVKVGDEWVVSCGVHDRFTELHRFSHSDIEDAMVNS